MKFSKQLKRHQAMLIVKSGTPLQCEPTGQALGMAVRYKGFVIETQLVNVCTEARDNDDELVIKGQRPAYKIYHSATKLIYGIRSTLASAQHMIDKNGVRWLGVNQ